MRVMRAVTGNGVEECRVSKFKSAREVADSSVAVARFFGDSISERKLWPLKRTSRGRPQRASLRS
jgi:hypothetical protein